MAVSAKALKEINETLKKIYKSSLDNAKAVSEEEKAYKKLDDTLKGTTEQLDKINKGFKKSTKEVKDFKEAVKKTTLDEDIKGAREEVEKLTKEMADLAKAGGKINTDGFKKLEKAIDTAKDKVQQYYDVMSKSASQNTKIGRVHV